MTKAHDAKDLAAAMDFAAEFAQKILVERTIRGREIRVSVLGNETPEASVPGEIVPHREFYDYAAKYLEEGSRAYHSRTTRARAGETLSGIRRPRIPRARMPGHGARGLFLEHRTGRILLNEINTIPGFTRISMYPKLWEASGLSYRDLLDRLIDLALEQHHEKQRTKYSIELPAAPSSGALES